VAKLIPKTQTTCDKVWHIDPPRLRNWNYRKNRMPGNVGKRQSKEEDGMQCRETKGER